MISRKDSNLSTTNVGKVYVQHNDVAMGAPLAPIIADISMAPLEASLMDELSRFGVCKWYRYVDESLFCYDQP